MNANQITGTPEGCSSAVLLCNVVFSLNHFTNHNDVVYRYLPLTAKSYTRLQPVQTAMPAFISPAHLQHSDKTATAISCPDGYLLLPFLFDTRW